MRVLLTVLLLLFGEPLFAQQTAEQAALALAQQGKTEEAITAFRSIVSSDPANPGAADALAQLLYFKEDFSASYETAMRGLAAAPEDHNLCITRAKAAVKLGKSDEAILLMDGLINLDGSFFYPWYVRALALDAQGRTEEAIEACSRAIVLSPQFPMAWLDRAKLHYRLEQDEAAMADAMAFLRMAPDHDGGLNLRGLLYSRMNRPDAAVESFAAAIASNPANAALFLNRGQAYEALGRRATAEADYRRAIQIRASDPEPHFALARSLHARGDYEASLAAVRTAIGLSPEVTAYRAFAAKLLLAMGKDEAALSEAGIVLASDDCNTEAWLLRSAALNNQDRLDESLAAVDVALGMFPYDARLYAMRSYIYKRLGKPAEAAADEARARRLGRM